MSKEDNHMMVCHMNDPDMLEKMTVSVGEAAGLMDYEVEEIYKLINGGHLMAVLTWGGRYRVFKDSLKEWLT